MSDAKASGRTNAFAFRKPPRGQVFPGSSSVLERSPSWKHKYHFRHILILQSLFYTPHHEGVTLNALTAFGLFAVTAMLVFYALEKRGSWFILAFASACVLASIYGFLQGAWPFGAIEAVWSLVALHRWRIARAAK